MHEPTDPRVDDLMVVDAHVHFWDPTALHYPWLASVPALDRAFTPADQAEAAGDARVRRVLFVEANVALGESAAEVEHIEAFALTDPRIAGIVAFADLTDPRGAESTLDALARRPLVRGVRHNIQGEPAGFCVQDLFVDGVRRAGAHGLAFDLCVTHDQLGDAVQLVRRCPDTRFVLDHCGKPGIRDRLFAPWSEHIAALAACANVSCKLSGLLTEADLARWTETDLLPYADHVLACFGAGRLLFGSDWPVLTLAGTYDDWFGFTRRFTASWSADERAAFYSINAVRTYRL